MIIPIAIVAVIVAAVLFLILKKKKKSYSILHIPQLESLMDNSDLTIVDSRGKYFSAISKIESAICIPDIEFDTYTHLLPNDKSAPIVFYCRDKNCKLSAKSAVKALNIGYENVYIFTEGIEGWNRHKGIIIEKDTSLDKRQIDKDNFKPFYKENKDSILLIDVNDKSDYLEGHLKNATSIPLGELPGSYPKLSTDNILIFYCATGIKSKEAVSFLIEKNTINPEHLFYLNASVSFSDEGKVIFEEIAS